MAGVVVAAVGINHNAASEKITSISQIVSNIDKNENYKMNSDDWKYVGNNPLLKYNGLQIEFSDGELVDNKHCIICSDWFTYWIQ